MPPRGPLSSIKSNDGSQQQYKELNEKARRRWTIGSWLFFAVCLLACVAFLYLLQIDPTEILSDMQN